MGEILKSSKIALVCSSGGHLLQLRSLEDFWKTHERFWVTFDREDARSQLGDERVYFAYSPTNRHVVNFFRNFILALKILSKERPRWILSTGAGVAVPFIYAAKLLGIRSVFVDSLTRVKGLSLSGKLVYFVADKFLVQWPELAARHRRAAYQGRCL